MLKLARLSFGLCLGLSTFSASGVEDEPVRAINYAFSTYLGTGFYSSAGQNVQIYSLPLSFDLKESRGKDWGFRLSTPMTFGFFNFSSRDILDGDIPDNVGTFSIVPRAEFILPITKTWTIFPFTDMGYGTNLTTQEQSLIYGTGIRNEVYWLNNSQNRWMYTNKLFFAGYAVDTSTETDRFISFENGLEYRVPWDAPFLAQTSDIGFYYINFQYLQNLTFFRVDNSPLNIYSQNEFGLTLNMNGRLNFHLFEFPRLGIGYRFGEEFSSVRLLFSMPF